MARRRFNSIRVRLVPDDSTPSDRAALKFSTFGTYALSFHEDIVISNLAPGVRRGSSLGRLWSKILPVRGRYDVELAMELPWFLPNLNGRSEFLLDVAGATFFVCNRMVKAYVGTGRPDDDGLRYYILHRRALKSLEAQIVAANGLRAVALRSFVSRRFSATADTAEEVIADNYLDWQDELLEGAYQIQAAFKVANQQWGRRILAKAALATCRIVWLIVRGRDDRLGHDAFAADIDLAAFRTTSNVTGNESRALRRLLRAGGKIAPHVDALELARTFIHYGLFELAVIQLCVASEHLLSVAVKHALSRRGVSNAVLSAQRDAMTFTHMLNVHLPILFRLTSLPMSKDIIADVNWARKRRNEIVHAGRPVVALTRSDLVRTLRSVEMLLGFLQKRIPARVGM